MDKDETNLIRRIKRGDKEAFKHLFDTYYQRLFLYALSYVEDIDVSEDIVQELFFNLWEKRREVIITTSLSSYLFRAVHNRSIQFLRHKKVASNYEAMHNFKLKEADMLYQSSGDFTFSEIQLNEIQDIITRTFDLLPEKTREIFTLSRDHSNSNKEIAKILKISIKTVEYHITKTLKILRTALNDYFIF